MINKLTKEQINKFPEYVDKWLTIGLSTERCDRLKAQKAAKLCYQFAGLDDPKFFIWSESPYQQLLSYAICENIGNIGDQVMAQVRNQVMAQVRGQVMAQVSDQVSDQVRGQVMAQVRGQVMAQVSDQVSDQVMAQVWDQVEAQVGDQVWDQVEDQVMAQVWDQVWAQVGDQVWSQVWDQVGDQVGDQVWSQVWDQVGDQVEAQVGDQVWDQVEDQVGDQVSNQETLKKAFNGSIYGSQDSGWLSFYSFMRDELKLIQETDKLIGLMTLAEHCGWWIPCKNICFLSEKPIKLLRDEQNRLHNNSGMAIEYADGWGIYASHGVRLPEYVIKNPELISIDKINEQSNAEIRRVMIEKYGLSRYLENSHAELIHKDEYGELYKKEIENDEPLVMVKVINSTPEHDGTFKNYFLRVPPSCATAKEAVAWTFSLNKSSYNPLIET